MHNSDTELLFPLRVIPSLSLLRGKEWKKFLEELTSPEVDRSVQLAFVYLMVRLGGCVTCNADSYRAMRGCTQCARQTVKRYRGSDLELIGEYNEARKEVDAYLIKQKAVKKKNL